MRISVAEARRLGILPTKRRAKKPGLPASFTPHGCVAMGIDLGKRSGWGILLRGGETFDSFLLPPARIRLWYGESSDERDWWGAALAAVALAKLHKMPLVVGMETWTQGDPRKDRRMRAMTLLGLGEVRGAWKRLLKTAGVPKRRIIVVNAMTWRGKLFGGRMARPRDEWKAAALQRICTRYVGSMESTIPAKLVASGEDLGWGADAAEGACLAEYTSLCGQAGEVVRQAGKRSP